MPAKACTHLGRRRARALYAECRWRVSCPRGALLPVFINRIVPPRIELAFVCECGAVGCSRRHSSHFDSADLFEESRYGWTHRIRTSCFLHVHLTLLGEGKRVKLAERRAPHAHPRVAGTKVGSPSARNRNGQLHTKQSQSPACLRMPRVPHPEISWCSRYLAVPLRMNAAPR
jgi:hypothetical protein